MLAAIRIESLAIIEELEVEFGPGLNVLTGETGAGKSILVDALTLLLGGRADPGVVRSGCSEAVVEGLFRGAGVGARLRACGLPDGDDELLVRRVVAKHGRSRIYVNGALATAAILQELTRGLVDLSGQHEYVTLLRPERHLELLDGFAGVGELRRSYEASYAALCALCAEREALLAAEAERERRREFLDFQLAEFEELSPLPGEEEALLTERRVLAASERIGRSIQDLHGLLCGDDGALVDRLKSGARRFEDAVKLDPELAPLLGSIVAATSELEEAGRTLARRSRQAESEPERLAYLDDRLAALRRLARKHGGTIEDALRARERLVAERAADTAAQGRIAALDPELARSETEARTRAAALRAARHEAAARFSREVQRELPRLALPDARFEVAFVPVASGGGEATLTPRGLEDVAFRFCANAGEDARELTRVASGGELSRLLLAMKRVLAAADPVATYVFDEVDAGIGGATALAVGRLLREIARERQVLCVTHLAQVAAHADVHLHVAKEVRDARTRSRVERLDEEEARCRSLARLLAGDERGKAARAAAAELLQSCRAPTRSKKRSRAA